MPREYSHSDIVSTGNLTSVSENVQIILLFSSLMLHVTKLICEVSSFKRGLSSPLLFHSDGTDTINS